MYMYVSERLAVLRGPTHFFDTEVRLGNTDTLTILFGSRYFFLFNIQISLHIRTWQVGGSLSGQCKCGLSAFGRDVMKRMKELRMVVDLAHAHTVLVSDILDLRDDDSTYNCFISTAQFSYFSYFAKMIAHANPIYLKSDDITYHTELSAFYMC